MSMNDHADVPEPIADDAPNPDESGPDATVGAEYRGQIAFDYDGDRYCVECISQEYADLALKDPYQIPYGGPVPSGAEVDCPGYGCGHCLRKIEGFTLLHYDGVCGENCPEN